MSSASPTARARAAVRSGAWIAVAMAVQNLTNYAFTIIAARRLGPAQYSAVASLMGLLLVVVVLSLGLQATGARKIAAAPDRKAEIESGLMSASYLSALALGAGCLLLTPLIAWVLQLDSWYPALMIAFAAVPLTIVGGQSGVLQGEHRWTALAGIYLAIGVGRCAIGALAVVIHPTATSAMAGVAIAAWLPALVGALALGHVGARGVVRRATVARGEQLLREVATNSHALLAFFALSNADVIVARVVFDQHQAGLYAGGLILAKAVLFLPQFVIVLAFPRMAQPDDRRTYLPGLALIAVIGLVATLGAVLLSGLAVVFIGGEQYAAIRPQIGWFALLGTVLAMLQLMVYEVVARQRSRAVWLLWVGLVAVAATSAYVADERALVLSVVAIDTVLLVVLLLGSLRRRPRSSGPAACPRAAAQ
jgi:O-antigen/teichoic acid export membrane protein